MADNTDEEHLDNPANTQSENSSNEITFTVNADNNNEIQETKNMEVHHHAHDPAMPHHKKNWKSYFWEFLMLFLAVFCGFLAESYHTHLVNKGIEKRNIEMMLSGLKNDTAQLNRTIFRSNERVKYLDTLLSFQGTHNIETLVSYRFGDLFYKCGQVSYFISNDAAFEQMKSSGSIKLIENKSVLDSIYAYNQANTIINANKDYLEKHQSAAIQNSSKFMNYQKAFQIKNDPTTFAPDIVYNGNDKINIILEFFNDEAALRMVLSRFYIPQLRRQNEKAITLIEFLKKEYKLED